MLLYKRKGSTKLKESTRQLRHDKKLAELLNITLKEVQDSRVKEEQDDKVREATAVQLFIEHPSAFIQKLCKGCGRPFLTTYKYVSDCSTQCRIKALEEIGIAWNPMHNPAERWGRATIPTGYVIPPAALQLLLAIAQDQEPAVLVDCETDEQSEENLYIEQSRSELHISPLALLLEEDDSVSLD